MTKTEKHHEEGFATLDSAALASVTGAYSAALFADMQQAMRMGLSIDSTVTGGHASHSFHYLGRAFDAVGTKAAMNNYYNWASHTKTSELIHNNHFLKYGRARKPIGGHWGHVHTAI